MNILVFGTGAIGSAFGGFLTRSSHSVYLYGRPRHLNPVRKKGLKVEGILGGHVFKKFAGIYTDFSKLKRAKIPFDLILVTVKSFDTKKAAAEIRKIASSKTAILSIQNGLGNIETLSRFFKQRQILGARAIFGVVLKPGAIKITVWGGDVLIGEMQSRSKTKRVQDLARLFTECGLPSKAVKEVQKAIWGKVTYNCALNPLAALLGVPYGALLKTAETKQLMKQIVSEIYAVAGAKKIVLSPTRSEAYLRLLFRKLIPDTARHYPSMYYDLKRGRRTEIDALNGAICRFGVELGVSTEGNDFVTALIRQKEKSR